MIGAPKVTLTIAFSDQNLDCEERDKEADRLLVEIKDLDEVESAGRISDPKPPEGNKTLGGFLVGLLSVEVSKENVKKLLGFLGDRLSGKTIELEVEADGKKLKVKASSQAELTAAIQAAKDFMAT